MKGKINQITKAHIISNWSKCSHGSEISTQHRCRLNKSILLFASKCFYVLFFKGWFWRDGNQDKYVISLRMFHEQDPRSE